MKKVLLLCAVLLLFSGCASTESSLQRATIENIEGSYTPSDITVEDIKREAMNVGWKAYTSDGKNFYCSADDMVRRVKCQQLK